MIILRKNFSSNKILNTAIGIDGRKLDQDMGRLGKIQTQRQLPNAGKLLGDEMRKLQKELNNGRQGKWLDTH